MVLSRGIALVDDHKRVLDKLQRAGGQGRGQAMDVPGGHVELDG